VCPPPPLPPPASPLMLMLTPAAELLPSATCARVVEFHVSFIVNRTTNCTRALQQQHQQLSTSALPINHVTSRRTHPLEDTDRGDVQTSLLCR